MKIAKRVSECARIYNTLGQYLHNLFPETINKKVKLSTLGVVFNKTHIHTHAHTSTCVCENKKRDEENYTMRRVSSSTGLYQDDVGFIMLHTFIYRDENVIVLLRLINLRPYINVQQVIKSSVKTCGGQKVSYLKVC